MIEVFTAPADESGAASRSVSNDIRLTAPSDVYFGSAAAGVAFYEKSGADLKVTLLDGQEVMVRDFFVIGPAGEYSRLRDGGADGSIEVTGLIAPEPFVPSEPSEPAQAAETEEPASPPQQPSGALEGDEVVVEVPADDSGSAAGAEAESSGNAGYSIGGLKLDQALFSVAMVPTVAMLDGGRDKDEPAADQPVQAAVEDTAPAEAAPQDGEPTEPAAETMDADTSALLTALMAPEDADADLFADDSSSPVALLASDVDGGAGDRVGDLNILAGLFDDFAPLVTEG